MSVPHVSITIEGIERLVVEVMVVVIQWFKLSTKKLLFVLFNTERLKSALIFSLLSEIRNLSQNNIGLLNNLYKGIQYLFSLFPYIDITWHILPNFPSALPKDTIYMHCNALSKLQYSSIISYFHIRQQIIILCQASFIHHSFSKQSSFFNIHNLFINTNPTSNNYFYHFNKTSSWCTIIFL